jgi:hypothetical protein
MVYVIIYKTYSKIGGFILNIKDFLFPFPTLYKSINRLNEKVKKLNQSESEKQRNYDYASNNENIEEKVLLESLKDTLETKRILEDKAKSTLIAVTITSSLIVNLLNSLHDMKSNSKLLLVLLAVVGFASLLYMVIAGVLSLYSIGEVNTYAKMFPEDYLLPEKEKRTLMADNVEYNYLYNLKRNNFMSTSYRCIITSISLLVFIYIITLIDLGVGYNSNNEVQESNIEGEVINSKITMLSDEISIYSKNIIELQKDLDDVIESEEVNEQKLNYIHASINDINKIIEENPNLETDEIKYLLINLEEQIERMCYVSDGN